MTTYEIIAALLGIAGFILGIINLVWSVLRHRPRLMVHPDESALFRAEISDKRPHPLLDDSYFAWIVSVQVRITNISDRDNSVASVRCAMPGGIKEVKLDKLFCIGRQRRNVFAELGYKDEKPLPVHWTVPEQWSGLTPHFLPPGMTRIANVSVEYEGEITDPMSVSILVDDAYGRTYRKSLLLKRHTPSDVDVIPPDECEAALE